MTMTIPEALPILSKGHHPAGSGRACAMDAVSWLSGRPEEGDAPSCVHPMLQSAFIRCNDYLPDERRHELWPLMLRAMGTWPTGLDARGDRVLRVRLAVWCARSVAHLVRERDRAVCERAVAVAEAWCEGRATEQDCWEARKAASSYASYASDAAAYAAYAVAAAVAAAYDAAYAASSYASDAADAAAYASDAAYAAAVAASSYASDAAYDASSYASDAADAAAYAASAYASDAVAAAADAAYARLAALDGLLTEYERLTERRPAPVPTVLITDLGRELGTVPA